jgi:hypothetical protein
MTYPQGSVTFVQTSLDTIASRLFDVGEQDLRVGQVRLDFLFRLADLNRGLFDQALDRLG